MKKKLILFLCFILACITLIGCGGKKNQDDTENTEKELVFNVTSQILFTNNINTVDYSKLIDLENIDDYNISLCKFQKIEEVCVVDEAKLNLYKEGIKIQSTEELLKRTDELPETEGIYSAVLLVEDAYRHKVANEIIVVYDTQIASINGVDEVQEEIIVEDLSVPWTDSLVGKLTVVDNVDGVIPTSLIKVEMKPLTTDNTKHEVKASYTDRAGNGVTAVYTITLKEAEKNTLSSGGGSTSGNGGGSTTGNGGTSQSGNKKPVNSNPGYSYEDRDGDGYADLAEVTTMNGFNVPTVDVSPDWAKFMRNLSAAGYCNIICDDYLGGSYGMLVPYDDYKKNRDKYSDMMIEHLKSLGLGWNYMDCGAYDMQSKAYRLLVYGTDVYELPPYDPEKDPAVNPDYIPPGVLN